MEMENSYRVVCPLSAFSPRINPGVIQGEAPDGALWIEVCRIHSNNSPCSRQSSSSMRSAIWVAL
jgi:hypothetical protein